MEKVDAGCEGIKVNLYGNDKGVDDHKMLTESQGTTMLENIKQ